MTLLRKVGERETGVHVSFTAFMGNYLSAQIREREMLY